MINVFFCLLCGFLILTNVSFAQTENSALGGKATCVVSGKSPVKRFTADANRILILQSEGISKGSIQLQLIQDSDASLIDVNILPLLGQIDDLDSFFNGKVFNFENNTSEISIKKTVKKNNTTLQLTNAINDEEFIPVSGKIKVQSPDQVVVSGTLALKLNSSSLLKMKDLEEVGSHGKNGKLNIRCKLKDIPVEIKEILF